MTEHEGRRWTAVEVEEAPPLPRGRVEPEAALAEAALAEAAPAQPPRVRDYLQGFLEGGAPGPAGGAGETELEEQVVEALRGIFDPEIPVNIYDLGLIYDVKVRGGHARVVMTLTTPHCPVAESMPGEVELRVLSVPGVATADVDLVWDPPWDPAKMSEEARLELGML